MTPETSQRVEQILRILADGQFHSGETIGLALNISRSAVWKLVQRLSSWQVTVFSVRGKGYRIPGGLDLLNQEKLIARLKQAGCRYKIIKVLTTVDSTASYIARQWQQAPGKSIVCIAEHQSAGRGRKGRPWISPFAANLYFSVGVEMPIGLSALGGMSLAVGMSLAETLNRYTAGQIKIKWPNDLLVEQKKLAGILVEASGDSNDHSFLNIGVGINWAMQEDQGDKIEQPWINLNSLVKKQCSRNEILAEVLIGLEKTLRKYQQQGFKPFAGRWSELSAFFQQPVILHRAQDSVEGREIGIEENGALRLKTAKGVEIFHSGEVSLRRQELREN